MAVSLYEKGGSGIPAVKYVRCGWIPKSSICRLLHSYVPKKRTVPGKDPIMAGSHPPYKPRRMPSCRHIVQYEEPRVEYFGGICGSPCCRVLTVSRECMSMSPVVPPSPPANMDCVQQVSIQAMRPGGLAGAHTWRMGGRASSSSSSEIILSPNECFV
jgi:hypothetical protein